MISSARTATLVLEKRREDNIPIRLLELRKKIQDAEYIDTAVQRIAQVISKRIIEAPEDDLIFGEL
ncbi:MAG: hypothetical protein J6I73_06475 [Treponema sp.]|nr:hypothetical protein [Treponema sp.]